MYKEVAFDPSCMSEIEYYYLVKQHFGFERGRYISAEVRPWAQEAMAHVKDSELQPVRKKSVKNYLNKLGRAKESKEFLLTRDRQAIEAENWVDWFEQQEGIRQFSCTVVRDAADDQINIDQIGEECEQWVVPPSISVKRTPRAIIGALYPLLVLSTRVTLIDPYFRISSNPSLRELFRALGGTSVNQLRVATTMDSPSPQDAYDNNLKQLNQTGMHFEWIKVPDKYFHDRYVITDVGAIKSGHGFLAETERGTHSDLANMNIIGYDEARRTISDLDGLLADNRASLELSI
jgi:hypothetical protein